MMEVVQVDFTDILAELEADKDLQEKIRDHQKELDRSSRSIITALNKIHSTPSHQGELFTSYRRVKGMTESICIMNVPSQQSP